MSIQIKGEIVCPLVLAFGICLLLIPVILPLLRRLKFGQTVRDDGPKTHLTKNGTPTMGGIIFILASMIPTIFFIGTKKRILPIIILTEGMGLVGFLDDYIKVVLKRSTGLKPWQKIILQLIVTGAFVIYCMKVLHLDLSMKIPFWPGHYINLGWFSIPFLYLFVVGFDNATNLTDGVDGLLSSITIIVACFFGTYAVFHGKDVAPICFSLVGALLGFLVVNCHPAKVFMGDTGSLAIGGFLVATAYVLQLPLFLIIIGAIYIVETVSVMLQVGYFKLTHGKRLFKMAPIHHHFELCGWSEEKVVTVFSIFTIMFCLVAFLAIW